MTLTKHGHHIPGTSTIDEVPFLDKARCGGPKLCAVCRKESSETMSYYSQVDMYSKPVENDPVNHPAHYTAYPIEVIEITAQMNFCIGNAVKYITRAQLKGKEEEDLQKALWYLRYELKVLNSLNEERANLSIEGVSNGSKLYSAMPYFLGRAVRALCEPASSVFDYRIILNRAIESLEAYIELQSYFKKD